MAEQAFFNFGGASTRGWSVANAPGIAPGSITFTVPTGTWAPIPVGTAQLVHGSRQMSLVDLKLRQSQIVDGSGGNLIRFSYADRRWRWQYGVIHGSYNFRKTVAGEDQIIREKTPQELATLLLDEMGETGYDVSRLPNDSRPEADWQRVNPAGELQSLCDSLGTLIVLNHLTNNVELWPIGQGSDVPGAPQSNHVIDRATPVALPRQPGQVRIVGGPAKFQSQFELGEPLGEETDGKLVSIDDLSYKPSTGWAKEFPTSFANVTGTYEKDGKTLKKIDLAKSSVWRHFKITGRKHGSGWSPSILADTDFEPTSVDEINFDSVKITKTEGDDGVERPEAASVAGEYYKGKLGYDNTPEGTPFKGSFTIDNERKIVSFNEPVYYFDDASEEKFSTPKNLILETSYSVEKEGVIVRYEKWRDNTNETYGAGCLLLDHPEMVREIVEDATGGSDDADNLDDMDALADHYLDAYNASLVEITAHDIRYEGIWPARCDGRIRQLSWSGGGGSTAITRLSIGQEPNPYVPTYEEHRRQEEAKREVARSRNENPKSRGSKR